MQQKDNRTIRRFLALATAVIGFINLFATISLHPAWSILLDAWIPDGPQSLYRLITICGFFLLMLSPALARGKRGAWRVTRFLLGLTLARFLVFNHQTLMVVVTVLLVILLTVFSRSFQAKSDPPSVRRGSVALFTGAGVVLLYALYGMFILHHQFERMLDHSNVAAMLSQLWTKTHLPFMPGTRVFLFEHALPLLCLSAVLYGIGQILRPVASALFPTEQQRQAVATLLRHHGESSISYFALARDKSYFFADGGQAVISYVLMGNVAVVAGDPIGPAEEMPQAIEQFLAFCQEQDWRVVFWQVREQLTAYYRSAGLHLLKIGEDAVLSVNKFTLAGKAMANVRTSARRAEKEGIHAVFWYGSVQDREQRVQIEQISRSWLAQRGGREMGFSMGCFEVQDQQELLFVLAIDPTRKVHAFVTFVPIYGRHGWAMDLMRRADSACPGTMEYLLVHAITHFKALGTEIVSLGLAPLSDSNASKKTLIGKGIVVFTQRTAHQNKQQTLFAFKKKFQPDWESRYLAYSSTLTLPKAGWALYRAHQPEGSLLLDLARWLRERHPGTQIAPERPAKVLAH